MLETSPASHEDLERKHDVCCDNPIERLSKCCPAVLRVDAIEAIVAGAEVESKHVGNNQRLKHGHHHQDDVHHHANFAATHEHEGCSLLLLRLHQFFDAADAIRLA